MGGQKNVLFHSVLSNLLFHFISEELAGTNLYMLQKRNIFTQPPTSKEVTFKTINTGIRIWTDRCPWFPCRYVCGGRSLGSSFPKKLEVARRKCKTCSHNYGVLLLRGQRSSLSHNDLLVSTDTPCETQDYIIRCHIMTRYFLSYVLAGKMNVN